MEFEFHLLHHCLWGAAKIIKKICNNPKHQLKMSQADMARSDTGQKLNNTVDAKK